MVYIQYVSLKSCVFRGEFLKDDWIVGVLIHSWMWGMASRGGSLGNVAWRAVFVSSSSHLSLLRPPRGEHLSFGTLFHNTVSSCSQQTVDKTNWNHGEKWTTLFVFFFFIDRKVTNTLLNVKEKFMNCRRIWRNNSFFPFKRVCWHGK